MSRFSSSVVALLLLATAARAQVVTEFEIPSGAHALAIAPGPGGLWFTEEGQSRVGRITPDGRVTEFDVPGPGQSIVEGPDGNLWYTGYGFLARLTPQGSVMSFPLSGRGYGVTVGPDRNIWFTELAFEGSGAFLGRATPDGVITELPITAWASSLAVGPDGNLWLPDWTEMGFDGVVRATPAGAVTRFGPWGDIRPDQIVAGPDGHLWVSCRNSFAVARISTSGAMSGRLVGGATSGIAVGPDGNLWLTFPEQRKVGRLTTAGSLLEIALPQQGSQPYRICAGPDGNMWFTERGAARIGRVSLATPPVTTLLTIPAVASISGVNGVLFRSDVYLFNRSHAAPVTATLTYRCYRSLGCGGRSADVALQPRQSVLVEDVVGRLLGAPGTAGALEISAPAGAEPLNATSRVYSSSAAGTFGESVPALPPGAARSRALLLGVARSAEFRSNAGVYNPNDVAATVVFSLLDQSGQAIGSMTLTALAHEVLQVNDLVGSVVGIDQTPRRDATLVVTSTVPVFSYLTVIDNRSGDAVFVSAEDDDVVPSQDVSGEWTGTFNPWDWLDCTLRDDPARASFRQAGQDVTGTLDTRASDCGFVEARFAGTVRGDVLTGTVTVPSGPASATGTISANGLVIDVEVPCAGVLCIPGGRLRLHR